MTKDEYLKALQNLRVEQYETLGEIREILEDEKPQEPTYRGRVTVTRV